MHDLPEDSHQYPPRWSGPAGVLAGVLAGVPLVWDDGFCTACAELSRARCFTRLRGVGLQTGPAHPVTD
jgi:hypothetical protein